MPRDLAGLAALGALGYMLSKKDKSPDVDTSKVSDVDLTGGARSMDIDTGEVRDETGALSKLRRNTETGDLYSPDEPITRSSSPRKSKSTDSDITPIPLTKGTMKDYMPEKMASQQFPMTAAPKYEPPKPKEKKQETYRTLSGEVKKKSPKEDDSDKPSPVSRFFSSIRERGMQSNPDAYKRSGGTVKMAKGGVTSSASRRADGIASKGKTRGKIC